ncbi:unnamed protein product, partial [Allacma fusca]
PFYFTAAGRQDKAKNIHMVLFMNQAMMIGDGHIHAMVHCMVDEEKYGQYLDNTIYRRDLLASDLFRLLDSMIILPKKLFISIGNFDVVCNTSYDDFTDEMTKIANLLKEKKVTELILAPLVHTPQLNNIAFDHIKLALETDWGLLAGAKTTRVDEFFEQLDKIPPPRDEFGPYHNIKRYEEILDKLAEKFIPLPISLQEKIKKGKVLQPPSKDRRRIEMLRKGLISKDTESKPTMSVPPTIKQEEMETDDKPYTPDQLAELKRIEIRKKLIEQKTAENAQLGKSDEHPVGASTSSELAPEDAQNTTPQMPILTPRTDLNPATLNMSSTSAQAINLPEVTLTAINGQQVIPPLTFGMNWQTLFDQHAQSWTQEMEHQTSATTNESEQAPKTPNVSLTEEPIVISSDEEKKEG